MVFRSRCIRTGGGYKDPGSGSPCIWDRPSSIVWVTRRGEYFPHRAEAIVPKQIASNRR